MALIVETGHDAKVEQWMRRNGFAFMQPFVSLAIVQDGEVIAAAVFNNYDAHNMDLSIATDGPMPFRRGNLRAVFHYPFNQVGVSRVTVKTRAKNIEVRKLIRRLGFEPEGKLKAYFGDDDAIIYGLTKDRCRWLKNG